MNRELKYQISVRLLEHMAEAEDMTVAEYGQVYDSEKHEQLLNDLMRLIANNGANGEETGQR